jgi:hypothetical protein
MLELDGTAVQVADLQQVSQQPILNLAQEIHQSYLHRRATMAGPDLIQQTFQHPTMATAAVEAELAQ